MTVRLCIHSCLHERYTFTVICIQRCHARYPFYFHMMNLINDYSNLNGTFCMFRDCAPVDTEMHGVYRRPRRAAWSRSDRLGTAAAN